MLETISLDRALCLPAPDVAALLHGQLIAIIPRVPVQKGWTFLLYPCVQNDDSLPIEQQYRSHVLPLAKAAIFQQQSEVVEIEVWAKCEQFKVLYEVEQLEALSSLSIWTKETLKYSLKQRQRVFLVFLRVYRVPDCIKVASNAITPDKLGKFVSLPALDKQFNTSLKIKQVLPVLNDTVFSQRVKQLEELRPPLGPELEEFQSIVSQFISINPAARHLEEEIRVFLGWANDSRVIQHDSDTTWITSIASVGNSSDGDLFEKLVRKSFIKLGFKNSNSNPQASLNPNDCGGAGGLDFYCEEPYPIVGECKATKTESVPDSTPAQLVKLGYKILSDDYNKCIKIIMAAGNLNSHAKQTAVGNKMNVIRPETLQKLVELKAKHQGSINLVELKPCLESAPFGEDADIKIKCYINSIWNGIKVRSHIVQSVKQLTKPEKRQLEVTEIMTCYNIKFAESSGMLDLDKQTVHELLIELASPLTGYLGRIRGTSIDSDRFYFLRDLPMD